MMISFFQTMGQMMMNVLIPLYVYDIGAPAQIVGMTVGAFAISAILVRPFIGPAFDAFNKKMILIISLLVIAVSTFLYSVATTVTSFAWCRTCNFCCASTSHGRRCPSYTKDELGYLHIRTSVGSISGNWAYSRPDPAGFCRISMGISYFCARHRGWTHPCMLDQRARQSCEKTIPTQIGSHVFERRCHPSSDDCIVINTILVHKCIHSHLWQPVGDWGNGCVFCRLCWLFVGYPSSFRVAF